MREKNGGIWEWKEVEKEGVGREWWNQQSRKIARNKSSCKINVDLLASQLFHWLWPMGLKSLSLFRLQLFRSTRAHLLAARLSLHLQLNTPHFTQAKTTDAEMSKCLPSTHELTEKLKKTVAYQKETKKHQADDALFCMQKSEAGNSLSCQWLSKQIEHNGVNGLLLA